MCENDNIQTRKKTAPWALRAQGGMCSCFLVVWVLLFVFVTFVLHGAMGLGLVVVVAGCVGRIDLGCCLGGLWAHGLLLQFLLSMVWVL